jgi:tripartite-type tricarboxylate transporter receptor subunit TctC
MITINRRRVLAAGLAMPFVIRAAHAQSWPGTVRIIVPFPPGGTVDPIARMVQPTLQQRLGVNVIVENKPGASGSIGAAQVAKSAPDGGTWLFVFDTHAVNPSLMNLTFDSDKDLDPVLLIGTAPNIIGTHPDRPWKSLADLVATAKEKPDTVTYASVGVGSVGHLSMVTLGKRAGVRWTHVPYRGGGPAMNDAIAGHVDTIIGSAALVTNQLKGGKLRGLAHTGAKPLKNVPDLPSAADTGYPGFATYAWWGVFAPAGTPPAMVERFGAELTAALREERTQRQLSETLQVDLVLGGPEKLRAFYNEQAQLWGGVVRENGIKGET